MQQSHARRGEALFSALMLAASIILFWQAYRIAGFSSLSSAGAFPLAATGVMVVAACVVFVRSFAAPTLTGERSPDAPILTGILAAFFGLVILFGAAMGSLGFLISTFVFLFASIWLLHRKGPLPALFFSVLSMAAVYIIFRLIFKVVLPEGIVPERRILALIGDWLGQLLGR